jgi:hypothetical protein
VGREKLINYIDVSVSIYAHLFEITTDHLEKFVINIFITHDEKKTEEREREREREKSRGTWPTLFRACILSRD